MAPEATLSIVYALYEIGPAAGKPPLALGRALHESRPFCAGHLAAPRHGRGRRSAQGGAASSGSPLRAAAAHSRSRAGLDQGAVRQRVGLRLLQAVAAGTARGRDRDQRLLRWREEIGRGHLWTPATL